MQTQPFTTLDRRKLFARARARKTQRGAVMFIVAMTLAVLASLGLYALHAASDEVKTSGYNRQNAQSYYMSEYGMLAGTKGMEGTTGQLYLGLMRSPTQRDDKCTSLIGVDPSTASDMSKACRRMSASELSGGWGLGVLPVDKFNGTLAGSHGPFAIAGDFYVEVTDPVQTGSMWGIDQKQNLCFVQFTVTSIGIVQPDTNILTTMPLSAVYASEGLTMSRARVTTGPMRCSQ